MNEHPTSAPNEAAATANRPAVPALYKAFSVLDLVSREAGISFTAIRKTLDLPKSSAHQLIGALCCLGALQDGPEGGYVLGLKLSELGAIAASQRSIEQEAAPFLKGLAREVGMTCHLGVLEGHEAIYLAKVEADQDIRINSWVGKRLSLYRSSLGKVLLAWQPDAERERLLADIEWIRKTPKSLPDADAVREHLREVRARGWAVDDEEDLANIRCVAAPVFDRSGNAVAAISAVGTVLQIGPDDFPDLAKRVCAVADEISHALGRH
ncbi:IclR family transcriptional regulator [Telmatospirillum sp.]|uniref:IclR family transcriptional regulator n=1 Tax=Telmatospirillum sp. TaxID=2079197 RepID=UPI00284537FC|nr:IclR family transcriptional regulator [Telmatospirillum sp.]MDR3441354.1 IclR family transcriptional regulator [Telmatospirillum sp.]